MDLRINPEYFGLNVLDTPSQINRNLSGRVMRFADIDVEEMHDIFGFQPVLQVSVTPLPEAIIFMGVKFITFKDRQPIHSYTTALRLNTKLLFTALDVADLTRVSRGSQMAGKWLVEAGVCIFAKETLRLIDNNSKQSFLDSLRFTSLISFDLEVVVLSSLASNLNPDGTLRNRARVRRTGDVTVSMNDI